MSLRIWTAVAVSVILFAFSISTSNAQSEPPEPVESSEPAQTTPSDDAQLPTVEVITSPEPTPEPTEELVVRRVPLSEAFRMVDAGEIRDALSVVALQAVELLALRGRLDSLLR